jgi:hypothetical protein
MKNTHIKAGQEVPIELRKEIYREALEIIKNWEKNKKYQWHTPYLCWLLPSILWDYDVWNTFEKTRGEKLHYSNFKYMFPELQKKIVGIISFEKDKDRIKFLKSVI